MRTNLTDIVLWQSLAIFLLVGALAGGGLGVVLFFWARLLQHGNPIARPLVFHGPAGAR